MNSHSKQHLKALSVPTQLVRIRSFFDADHAPLRVHPVILPELEQKDVTLDMVRDDLLHPMIAGNKWWKLKYALIHAAVEKIPTLVTFGGAYSNHILAVAAAGQLFGFQTIGIIRGDEPRDLSPVLSKAQEWGMQLKGVCREQYRQKNDPNFQEQLKDNWGPCLMIPEGGTSDLAVHGTCEMASRLETHYDYLCCPVATGGTLAGMITSAHENTEVMGFSALKNGGFLVAEVEGLIQRHKVACARWSILTEFHFGGYAKSDKTLRDFCENFRASQNMSLDLVYTGKMVYGILDLVRRDLIAQGTQIVAWHTGNTHGIESAKLGRYSKDVFKAHNAESLEHCV